MVRVAFALLLAFGCLTAFSVPPVGKVFQLEKGGRKTAVTNASAKAEMRVRFVAPDIRINHPRADVYSIAGKVVLGFSSAVKHPKNPLVRVALLFRSGSAVVMTEFLLDRPRTNRSQPVPPVAAWGAERRRTFPLGNGGYVRDLESLSYFQRAYAGESFRDIEYFDREGLLDDGYLRIPARDIETGSVPEVLVFRLECWQNGCLAGEYTSVRPATLKSRDIPVDWHVFGRHEERFSYLRR